jgi:hypothetical protein
MAKRDISNMREAENRASAAANAAREAVSAAQAEIAYYNSDAFFFSCLGSAIQGAETDAEGKFTIEVPSTGTYVIAAQAERSLGKDTESYYWLHAVALEGKRYRAQNLSNTNLGGASGISSLIFTH